MILVVAHIPSFNLRPLFLEHMHETLQKTRHFLVAKALEV